MQKLKEKNNSKDCNCGKKEKTTFWDYFFGLIYLYSIVSLYALAG